MSRLAAQLRRPGAYALGLLCAGIAAMIYSLAGFIIREFDEASGSQIVFYRSLALVPTLCVIYLLRHRGQWRARLAEAAPQVLRAGPFQAMSSTCFVYSLAFTTVASTLFIQGAVPIIAAALAWMFLRERPGGATLAAMAAVLAGVALMVGDGLFGGNLVGNLFALGAAIAFSCYIVLLRRGRNVDMLPSVAVGGCVAAVANGLLAPSLAVSLHDILLCFAWGSLLHAGGTIFYTYASRHIPASDLSLVGMLEIVLAPFWTWIAVSEVPSLLSILGGGVILIAVALWTMARARGHDGAGGER
ncbi:MAG: DMT family transporter [Alphaproteobacteria bacterium]|nr:DMT family transporter [Alphaproteobacteria bacterium]